MAPERRRSVNVTRCVFCVLSDFNRGFPTRRNSPENGPPKGDFISRSMKPFCFYNITSTTQPAKPHACSCLQARWWISRTIHLPLCGAHPPCAHCQKCSKRSWGFVPAFLNMKHALAQPWLRVLTLGLCVLSILHVSNGRPHFP